MLPRARLLVVPPIHSSLRLGLLCAILASLALGGPAAASGDPRLRIAAGTATLPLVDAWADASSGPPLRPLVSEKELAGLTRMLVRGEAAGAVVLGPLVDSALEAMPGALHLPLGVSGVALAANLPGNGPVKLTFEVLAAIELGRVRTWDDPAIAALNPTRYLPAWPITPLQRADPAEVTAVLSAALSQRVPEFREKLGTGTLLAWPTGRRLHGAHDLALELSMVRGALGYIDAVSGGRAARQGLTPIALPDVAGNFLLPEPARLRAAASGGLVGPDGRVTMPSPAAPGGWPITAIVYLVADPARSALAIDLARWALDDGAGWPARAGLGELPPRIRRDAQELLLRRDRLVAVPAL